MDSEGEKLLEEIKAKRGFVLDFHRLLAEEDHAFLRRYEDMVSAAYADDRTLDKKTKELIFIAALMSLEAEPAHIGTHMKLALEHGASKKEILEVLECVYPPCGTLRFMNALKAFKQTVLRPEK